MTDAVIIFDAQPAVAVYQPGDAAVLLVEPPQGAVIVEGTQPAILTDFVPTPVVTIEVKGVVSGAPQNVFVGDDDPGMTGPGLWIETAGGEVVTFWVNV